MSNLAERLPEKEFEEQALSLYERALAVMVKDQASMTKAAEFGKQIKDEIKRREDYFEPLRVSAKAAYDNVLEKKKEALSPLKEALETIYNGAGGINPYMREQERIRQEEERKARLAAEEAARKEQERLLALAAKAEEKGKDEKAEELLERAENVYVAPVTVAPKVETAKFDGGAVGQVKEVQITVTDLKVFLAEIVKRGMAPTMIEVKQGALKSWVKANGFEKFPGLSINNTVAARIR